MHLKKSKNSLNAMSEISTINILVVDDEEIVLLALSETLEQEDCYKVFKASTVSEALEIVKTQELSVIISDQVMSEMTGLDFLCQAREIQPHVSTILITGVLNLKTIVAAINKGEIYRFIAKPWIREELLTCIQNAVHRYELIVSNEALQKRTQEQNATLEVQIKQLIEQQENLDKAHTGLQENFKQSLELCHKIISTYNPMLGKETLTVVKLCNAMMEDADLTPEEKRTLQASAWLHKIGLLGVSRSVIHKARRHPDELTENERLLIRNHPTYGETIVSMVENLTEAGKTIRAQYEHWDGTGYPDELHKEEISLPARLLAIAVHYSESSLSNERTIKEIEKLSGTQFDPECVRIFTKATHLVNLPKRVKEILFAELATGMILAEDIHSPSGLLLIPEGSCIMPKTLRKMTEHNEVDPITERLFVYA